MNNPLISVIVPVYKAEKYFDKCVNSIINQTYKNLEIILVDDGSPDICGKMCDEFAEKDSRVRVFHKENGGQSSARNVGLDNMSGEYVGFVDSDDWIEPNMYERLMSLIKKYDAQISACGTKLEYLNGTSGYFNPDYPNDTKIRYYSTFEALEQTFNNTMITYSPCDKLYQSEIFSSLRMTEGRIYEDMEIIPKCIELADRVVYDPIPLYHYNLTEESTIRGEFDLKQFAQVDVAFERAQEYSVKHPKLYHKAISSYMEICLNVIHCSKNIEKCNERRQEIISKLRKKTDSETMKELSKKAKIKLIALKISPYLFELMMDIYDLIKK